MSRSPRAPTPITASAASASIRVKPATPRLSGFAGRHNFDASREPVDTYLISEALPSDRDNPSARCAARKEIYRRNDDPVATTLRKRQLEGYVGGNFDHGSGGVRDDNSPLGIERRGHLRVTPYGRVAVTL